MKFVRNMVSLVARINVTTIREWEYLKKYTMNSFDNHENYHAFVLIDTQYSFIN